MQCVTDASQMYGSAALQLIKQDWTSTAAEQGQQQRCCSKAKVMLTMLKLRQLLSMVLDHSYDLREATEMYHG